MGKDYSTFLQAGPAGGRWQWPGRRTLHRSPAGTHGRRYFMSMNLITISSCQMNWPQLSWGSSTSRVTIRVTLRLLRFLVR